MIQRETKIWFFSRALWIVCQCTTYNREITIYRKCGKTAEVVREHLCEQCVFREVVMQQGAVWIQAPSAYPREGNPNFRINKTKQNKTEDLQINTITHIGTLFSIPPASLLFTVTLLFTIPNKWLSQLAVKCKSLTQLFTWLWLLSIRELSLAQRQVTETSVKTHPVTTYLQKHALLRLPNDTTFRFPLYY